MLLKINLILKNKMFLQKNNVFHTGIGSMQRSVWNPYQINQRNNNNLLKSVSNLEGGYRNYQKFRIKTGKFPIRRVTNSFPTKMEFVYNEYSFGNDVKNSVQSIDISHRKSVLSRIQKCLLSGQKFKLQESDISSYNLSQTFLLNKVKKNLFPEEKNNNNSTLIIQQRDFSTTSKPTPKVAPLSKNLYQRVRPDSRQFSTLLRSNVRRYYRKPERTSSTVATQEMKKHTTRNALNSEKSEPVTPRTDTKQTQSFSPEEPESVTSSCTIAPPKPTELPKPVQLKIITQVIPYQNFDKAKSVVHNIYDDVANNMNKLEFKLRPFFTQHKNLKGKNSHWTCTYNIMWPEQLKFIATASTKKLASENAAGLVLNWLKNNEKITKDMRPILIDKKQAIELSQKFIKPLVLTPSILSNMNQMVEIYETKLVKTLVSTLEDNNTSEESLSSYSPPSSENISFKKNFKQVFLKPEKYMAKEKVELPISAYKDEFIELLRENKVVIVKGEPGCGKSTRIPQYVLESWITSENCRQEACRIAVTQPRRIAAISLAERVSSERNEPPGQIVGYQVRLKNNFIQSTGRILYCTTGILLRHLQSDPSLSNFTHIILDEAHERDVNTDLLMNLLRNTIQANSKLKLIVMSATIDTDIFREYFSNAPIIHIPGFTYPVKTNFIDDIDLDLSKSKKMAENESPNVIHEDVVKLIQYIDKTRDDGAILVFLPGWEDISKIQKLLPYSNCMVVHCLHSRLQHSDQWKIFSRPPPGVRKVILSTNIAETSVTIDDVVYVIDTGIHKENTFDNDKGVMCIDNYWISQASMIQRKGRAGRCQAGESFHLYTEQKHESLAKYTDPEILKTSLTKIVLDSKVYSNNMNAVEFMKQLLSPPEMAATRRAVRELKDLQLLDGDENLTHLGKALANFQLEPKLAKVLINSVVFKCVTPIVDIITLFSDGSEMFSSGLKDKEKIKRIKAQAHSSSDHLAVMRLFEKWLEVNEEYGYQRAEQYCLDANLAQYKLVTMEKLRQIHFDYLYGLKDALPVSDDYSDNEELVKAILFSGVGTVLHHRNYDIVKGRYKKSNVFLTSYNHKATITPESVNFKKTGFTSDLLVYMNEVRSNVRRTSLIRECSVISPLAVLLFSNKNLTIKANENNKVILGLEDTKIEFLCNPSDAEIIKKCKEVIDTGYQYFIFQMTEGGDFNKNLNAIWDEVLNNINSILINDKF